MNDQAHSHQHRLPPAHRGRAQDSSRDDAIIRAALQLLAEKGYHALTMTEVTARAGVSKATLYRRWTAKADLVADAIATLSPMVTPCYPGTSLRDDLLVLMEQANKCDGHSETVNAAFKMAWSHPELHRTLSDRFGMFLRQELGSFAVRAVGAGYAPLSEIEFDVLCDTVAALLAHSAGPEGSSTPRQRLIELVDHVLLVLLTGTRTVK